MRQYEQRFLSFSEHVPFDSRTLAIYWPRGAINNERPSLHVHLFFIEIRGSSINYIPRVQKTFLTEADNDKKHKTNKTISIHRKSLSHVLVERKEKCTQEKREVSFNHLSTLKDPICIRTEFSHGDGATHDSMRRWSSIGGCLCNR